jgi:hypothetical protein
MANRLSEQTKRDEQHHARKKFDQQSLRQLVREVCAERSHRHAGNRHEQRCTIKHEAAPEGFDGADRRACGDGDERDGRRLLHRPAHPHDERGNCENAAAGTGQAQHGANEGAQY